VRGAQYLNFVADSHVDTDLIPANNDLSAADSNWEGLVACIAAVERSSVSQSAIVVHFDVLAFGGLSTGLTFVEDLD